MTLDRWQDPHTGVTVIYQGWEPRRRSSHTLVFPDRSEADTEKRLIVSRIPAPLGTKLYFDIPPEISSGLKAHESYTLRYDGAVYKVTLLEPGTVRKIGEEFCINCVSGIIQGSNNLQITWVNCGYRGSICLPVQNQITFPDGSLVPLARPSYSPQDLAYKAGYKNPDGSPWFLIVRTPFLSSPLGLYL